MVQTDIEVIERKVEQLTHLCRQLIEENQQLKEQSLAWHEERGELIRKNDMARAKVEAMISRLKALAQD